MTGLIEDSEYPTRDNSAPKPYVVAFAKRLQVQLMRPGWAVHLSNAVAYDIADSLTAGEEMHTIDFVLPRDVFVSEYGQRKIEYERARLLAEIDKKGCIPAAPIEVVVRHTSWHHGGSDMPEDSDWDTAQVYLRCPIWRL